MQRVVHELGYSLPVTILAQGYNCDAYGASNYNECSVGQTNQGDETTTATSSGVGSLLANTGIMVSALVVLACILITTGLLLRIRRRKRS